MRYVLYTGGVLLSSVCIIAALVVWLTSSPLSKTMSAETVIIEPGSSIRVIAEQLESASIVRSDALFSMLVRTQGDNAVIKAGEYVFNTPLSLFAVVTYMTSTTPQEATVSITLPEGITITAMAPLLAESLENFSPADYVAATTQLEGFLFPETYFIPESYTAEQVIELQTTAYGETLSEINTLDTPLNEYDALILASILEREANTPESMGIVSGILQNRLALGMPLQADATIEYVLDTPLGDLRPGELAANLRDVESPYNTYKNTGLPPTPIGNPGKTALTAAYNPILTDYLFYITDNTGTFHYADTYAKHRQNIALYLQ